MHLRNVRFYVRLYTGERESQSYVGVLYCVCELTVMCFAENTAKNYIRTKLW
jgi:hypothetical protein